MALPDHIAKNAKGILPPVSASGTSPKIISTIGATQITAIQMVYTGANAKNLPKQSSYRYR